MVEEVIINPDSYQVGGERKRTVPFTVELREWLIIAHKIGLVFLDTLQDMRLLTVHQQGMVCGSFENLAIYQFSESSTDPDDGESVIKPENSYETGRWLLKAKLDSGYNELVFKELRTDFPTVGNPLYLYIARDTRYIYWWNPNTNTYHNAITNFATQSFFSENSGKLGGELPSHYYNLARLIDCITAGTDISIDSTSIAGKIIINYTGSSGGLTFSDLVGIIQAGTNITLDVDLLNETITINSVGLSSVDWDDITGKPTTFQPSAHTQFDSTIEISETYTGNLAGATNQKEVNDILDVVTPKLKIDYAVKNFAGQLYGMAIKCPTSSVTGRLIICEASAVNIYDIDLIGNVVQSTKTTIITTTTGCACYVPELDQFWVIQRLGDTIYRIDATNKTLTSTLTGLATATTVDRHCFEYYNGYVYFQRGAYCTGLSRINVTTDAVTAFGAGTGLYCAYGFEYNGTKYIASMAQVVTTGLTILLESDLSVYNNPNIQGLTPYHKILFYNGKLYVYSDYYITSTTQINHITKIFDMATLTYDADTNNCMISPSIVYGKYAVGRTNYGESTIILKDLATQKVVDSIVHQTIPNISMQPFAFCSVTNTIYVAVQNATAGSNAILVIKIF